MWQVGDLIEQNGTYNIYFVKEKYDILNFRIEHIIYEMELIPTDIIPLINKAWVNSFYEVEPSKKSVVECGWLPYNLNLFMHKPLRDTMTMKDIETD